MLVFSLDLGVRLGWAYGPADAVSPASGAVILKRDGEHRAAAFGNMFAWLNGRFEKDRPIFVVKEKMLALQAFRNLGNAEDTIRMTAGLHAIVEGLCARYAIRWEEGADSTVRKHFIGKGRLGNRTDTKAAVVHRAKLLKFIPRDCEDHDRADAVAIWDWAAATFCNRAGGALHLFNEVA